MGAGIDGRGAEPDVMMACAGDAPALEMLAAVQILKEHAPQLKIRVVNVIDLITLLPKQVHPHGLSDDEFDGMFTASRPIILPITVIRQLYTG